MSLNFRLEQALVQKLVMTPRLQQAIKLLQYNHLDMVEHVQEAVLENPTLEVVADTAGSKEIDEQIQQKATNEQRTTDSNDEHSNAEPEVNWDQILASMKERVPSGPAGGTIYDDLPPIETNLTYSESLSDHLEWQLKMDIGPDDIHRVAHQIIQNLDDRGYCALSAVDLSLTTGCGKEVVEEGVHLVQSFDPIGCGSPTLQDCLIFQAKMHFPEDSNFEVILRDHLTDLERKNYHAIAVALQIDLEDVVEYHRMIRQLEPIPGRGYGSDSTRYITPDLYVVKHEGEWVVTMNEDGMPDLKVSSYYMKVMESATKGDREYLTEKLKDAEFLIQSIFKRRKTIGRVMDSILKFQLGFFENGVAELKPLVLQDVADDVGVHMSTVSRVTSNKFVHTPHGLLELKYFFSSGVSASSGEGISSEAVKLKIKTFISGENKKKPLSDQAIANLLQEDSIEIARRTVAKYREAMGILQSSRRKNIL